MKMKCEIQIFIFCFRVRVNRMDAWTPKIKHPGYFRKDLNFCILKNINEYQKSWMFHWMFRNLRFLQSKFSLFDYRSISKDGYLQISDFLQSKSSYLITDQNRKVGFTKVGKETRDIHDIQDIRDVFDLACEQIHSYEMSSFKVSSILVKKLCHKLFKSPICVF